MGRDVAGMGSSGSKANNAQSVRLQLQILEHDGSDVVIGPRWPWCRVADASCFYSLHQPRGDYAEVGKADDRDVVRALFR